MVGARALSLLSDLIDVDSQLHRYLGKRLNTERLVEMLALVERRWVRVDSLDLLHLPAIHLLEHLVHHFLPKILFHYQLS